MNHSAPLAAVSQTHGTLDAVLNRLLNGFDGKLTTSKCAALAACLADTTLLDLGALQRSGAGGRSTHYELRQDIAVGP